MDGLAKAVADGRRASREGDWKGLGTANIHFHRELVALAGSARTDELMRSVFAELRLAFHLVDDPRRLHEPYLARNGQILQALQDGDREKAESLLGTYLDDSRKRVVEVYGRRVAGGRPLGARGTARSATTGSRSPQTTVLTRYPRRSASRRLGRCQTEDLVCAP